MEGEGRGRGERRASACGKSVGEPLFASYQPPQSDAGCPRNKNTHIRVSLHKQPSYRGARLPSALECAAVNYACCHFAHPLMPWLLLSLAPCQQSRHRSGQCWGAQCWRRSPFPWHGRWPDVVGRVGGGGRGGGRGVHGVIHGLMKMGVAVGVGGKGGGEGEGVGRGGVAWSMA